MTEENMPGEESVTATMTSPSKALTISPKRLAGSVYCLNCGVQLAGPFCHYCGQPDKNFMRFFPVLLAELLEDFIGVDSRFLRTLKALLFHPGKLTRDYLAGSRFRYTPPLRLYIFSSMAFFILAAMLAGDAIRINADNVAAGKDSPLIQLGGNQDADLDDLRAELNDVNPALADKVERAVKEAERAKAEAAAQDKESGGPDAELDVTIDNDDHISFNDKPWDRETNPLIVPMVPDWVNEWINDEIEKSPQKGREIEANPNLIVDKIFDVLPGTMFVLLPLSALLIKFWYMFANRYYIEHLILALHNHSFLFVVFLLSMLLGSLAGWLEPGEEGPVTSTVHWLKIALMTWIPIYFLLSLKRVYQQSWKLTVAKYMVIGLSYTILLIVTASVAALLSFVLI